MRRHVAIDLNRVYSKSVQPSVPYLRLEALTNPSSYLIQNEWKMLKGNSLLKYKNMQKEKTTQVIADSRQQAAPACCKVEGKRV